MSARADETDAALYLGGIGALYAFCTYVAASRSLGVGMALGAVGVVIVLVCGAVARNYSANS